MHILYPTAVLVAQAGMIASLAASFAWPAMALGMAQAMAHPHKR